MSEPVPAETTPQRPTYLERRDTIEDAYYETSRKVGGRAMRWFLGALASCFLMLYSSTIQDPEKSPYYNSEGIHQLRAVQKARDTLTSLDQAISRNVFAGLEYEELASRLEPARTYIRTLAQRYEERVSTASQHEDVRNHEAWVNRPHGKIFFWGSALLAAGLFAYGGVLHFVRNRSCWQECQAALEKLEAEFQYRKRGRV